eukprot:CAMPEP_0185203626 /NCGR_PEP_ID=MMETSP1140-20130426/53377_1 /TAXON_ID=298111 /ORGANISM="Pavlova sp., Strain CCMP459" /LENGTH=132 /DNA_ID=CAMNT_0027771137 /DNA_START=135 /DNA_END=534 /DNA_ORIENTATION=+
MTAITVPGRTPLLVDPGFPALPAGLHMKTLQFAHVERAPHRAQLPHVAQTHSAAGCLLLAAPVAALEGGATPGPWGFLRRFPFELAFSSMTPCMRFIVSRSGTSCASPSSSSSSESDSPSPASFAPKLTRTL